MNKKVIKVMIILVAVFLAGLYVLKIFFPEQFVMAIQNEAFLTAGAFIDQYWWLQEICDIVVSLATYWLYLGALTKRWFLSWKQLLAVLLTIAVTHGAYYLDPALCSSLSVAAMIILPAIFKANSMDIAVVFSIHSLAQVLSTLIRGLPFLLTDVNYITILFLSFEGFLWLFLFYFYYNYRRNKNGKNNATILLR